jgi:SAM-dependent methyltransferase
MILSRILSLPETRGIDLDDPRTTALRRQIIADKKFLHQIYEDWYRHIAAALPPGDEPVLEIGSGAGFLKDYVQGLVASEVFLSPGVDLVADAMRLPFADGSLRGIVMTDVLHHVPDVRRFFSEATRCVRAGGVIAMIEPWITSWSRFIYARHHEPFAPEATNWEIPASGPLSGANIALPWILFARDLSQFHQEFPAWRLKSIEPTMPFRYLLSGGVSMRSLMPGWAHRGWRAAENLLRPWMDSWAMFAYLVLERSSDGQTLKHGAN